MVRILACSLCWRQALSFFPHIRCQLLAMVTFSLCKVTLLDTRCKIQKLAIQQPRDNKIKENVCYETSSQHHNTHKACCRDTGRTAEAQMVIELSHGPVQAGCSGQIPAQTHYFNLHVYVTPRMPLQELGFANCPYRLSTGRSLGLQQKDFSENCVLTLFR